MGFTREYWQTPEGQATLAKRKATLATRNGASRRHQPSEADRVSKVIAGTKAEPTRPHVEATKLSKVLSIYANMRHILVQYMHRTGAYDGNGDPMYDRCRLCLTNNNGMGVHMFDICDCPCHPARVKLQELADMEGVEDAS